MSMGGRLGKYGDAKCKAQIRETRLRPPADGKRPEKRGGPSSSFVLSTNSSLPTPVKSGTAFNGAGRDAAGPLPITDIPAPSPIDSSTHPLCLSDPFVFHLDKP